MNFNPAQSLGTQVNRSLDRLGLADSFGDKIGALVDLQRGDIAGAMRNLFDLTSGLKTSTLDNMSARTNPAFGGGFVPRHCSTGKHLEAYRYTYTTREQVGTQAHVGQKYNYSWGPFQCQGRITGRQYCGSFSKPIHLKNDQWLYKGRTYPNLNSIYRDAKDGRVDGTATQRHTGVGLHWVPNQSPFQALQNAFNQFPFNPLQTLPGFGGGIPGIGGGGVPGLPGIQDIIGGLFNAISQFQPGQNGQTPGATAPSTPSTGNDSGDLGSVLNGGGTLEEKIALLMSKLSDHFDKEIQAKMGEVEKAMSADKNKSAQGQGGKGESSNLQLLQTQLQQLIDKRNQMFQTVSQMLKSLGDTSNAIIRNLKA